jgi:hypothetical protein
LPGGSFQVEVTEVGHHEDDNNANYKSCFNNQNKAKIPAMLIGGKVKNGNVN